MFCRSAVAACRRSLVPTPTLHLFSPIKKAWKKGAQLSTCAARFERKMAASAAETAPPFAGKPDRFRGVTVSSGEEPCPPAQFEERLAASLEKWTDQGIRAVWFHVRLAESEWIPVLGRHGFDFHHANPERVALVKWLPKDEANQIPPYAHHMIGVGGLVVNEKDELLAIQETYATVPQWKLPGGYVDPKENIHDAAVREVREETGVETEFRSIMSFRHAHGYNFGCSDIYVVALLKPLSHAIEKCPREISKCEWIPLRDFVRDRPDVNNMNRMVARRFIKERDRGVTIGLTNTVLRIKDLVKEQQFYALQFDGDDAEVNEEGSDDKGKL